MNAPRETHGNEFQEHSRDCNCISKARSFEFTEIFHKEKVRNFLILSTFSSCIVLMYNIFPFLNVFSREYSYKKLVLFCRSLY